MSVGFNSYDDFKKYMEDSGLKTTTIHEQWGEANFFDYGAALSDDLKDMICNPNKYNLDASDDATDGFDKNDERLQAEVAALFKNKNVMQRGDFVETLRSMGYEVSVSYVKSTYIPDNKADGHWDTNVSTASIGVYTISDGKGGDLIVADANGNGALESEEVMMNHILDGVNADVMADIKARQGVNGVVSSGASEGISDFTTNKDNKGEEVSQIEFNNKVEEYLEDGYGKSMAVNLANGDLDIALHGMQYTGSMEAKVEGFNINEEDGISKEEFNKAVENLANVNGKTKEEAISLANKQFGTDFEYTGNDIKEEEVEEKEAA